MKTLALVVLLLGGVRAQDPISATVREVKAGRLVAAERAFGPDLSACPDAASRAGFLASVHVACREAGALGDLITWLGGAASANDPVVNYHLGFALSSLMLRARARTALRAALAADPGSPEIILLLAHVAARRFRHGEAAALAARAGAAGSELAEREGRLRDQLTSTVPRQWLTILGGALLLCALAWVAMRRLPV